MKPKSKNPIGQVKGQVSIKLGNLKTAIETLSKEQRTPISLNEFIRHFFAFVETKELSALKSLAQDSDMSFPDYINHTLSFAVSQKLTFSRKVVASVAESEEKKR
jgi:hypothetical protein